MLNRVPRLIRSTTFAALLGAGTASHFNDHVMEITNINGISMSPTLSPAFESTGARDRVMWKKRNPTADLQRGDVVLFSVPHNPEGIAVKRIVAMGEDIVLLDRKRRPEAVRNGRPNPEARNWDMWHGRVKVPEGHVWIEGDNWRDTQDSNAYGPISKGLIKGKAIMLVQPLSQLGSQPWTRNPNQTRVIEGTEDRTDRNETKTYWPH